MGIVRSFEIEEYRAIVGNEVSKHRLASNDNGPRGGAKFLEEHEGLDEWPDLDDDPDEVGPDSSNVGDSSGR